MEPSTASRIRNICRTCRKRRYDLVRTPNFSQSELTMLNLVIVIIGHFFDQKDLQDWFLFYLLPSWSRPKSSHFNFFFAFRENGIQLSESRIGKSRRAARSPIRSKYWFPRKFGHQWPGRNRRCYTQWTGEGEYKEALLSTWIQKDWSTYVYWPPTRKTCRKSPPYQVRNKMRPTFVNGTRMKCGTAPKSVMRLRKRSQ